MRQLSDALLRELPGKTPATQRPTRVAMMGEGVFLRTFIAWMIDILNEKTGFNGNIAVMTPIATAPTMPFFKEQDLRYTVLLRGLDDEGKPQESARVVTALNDIYNSYDEWRQCLALFALPDLRFLFSNTTEAGIAWGDDAPDDAPPATYPGKLAALLRHRFVQGLPGMHIIPCELIDLNGQKLRELVLRHLRAWNDEAAAAWVESQCTFTDTLVDRIVTGYPREEIDVLTDKLGYEDKLLTTGEAFGLFVLRDGPARAELPFEEAGLPVIWTPDIAPYRERKVRILNGAHTLLAAIAPACGVQTVREAVEDADLSRYLLAAMQQEILPGLDLPEDEKQQYAQTILSRFANPYMAHRLESIALNAVSKFIVRVGPSIVDTARITGRVPQRLAFGCAAQITAVRSKRDADAAPIAHLWGRGAPMSFGTSHLSREALEKIAYAAVSQEPWAALGQVEGFAEAVAAHMVRIQAIGMREALEGLNDA